MVVDIMQWGANATSSATSKFGSAMQSSEVPSGTKESSGIPFEDDEDDDEMSEPNNDFLVTLNNEAFVKLNK